MNRDELTGIGERRKRAKTAYDKVHDEARDAARAAAADGMTEVDITKALGVDRMTVRSWLGKKRGAAVATTTVSV